MERLGAIVRRYVLNQYGTTTSHLHGGLPTDRCDRRMVAGCAARGQRAGGKAVARPQVKARVEVPADIAALRKQNLKRARAIQKSHRRTVRALLRPRSGGDRLRKRRSGWACTCWEMSPE